MAEPDIAYAHAVDVGRCANPACRDLHIHFLDGTGKLIAMGVVTDEWWHEIAAKLRNPGDQHAQN